MKTAGIIAEYNPLHNGHLYQIEALRAAQPVDYLIVVLSGDFVQRGEPAIFDKYLRTEAALQAGADLVLELPAAFATSSAEDFAGCGVAMLDKLGVVDLLCFGSECGTCSPLAKAAALLAEEPKAYQTRLKELTRMGLSFPAARSQALSGFLEEAAVLSTPNNILGVEYLKALRRRLSSIEPVTIRRTGAGYHDVAVPADPPRPGQIPAPGQMLAPGQPPAPGQTPAPGQVPAPDLSPASATALRRLVRDCQWESFFQHTPAFAQDACRQATPVFADDLSLLLNQRLLQARLRQENLEPYLDMSPELAARLSGLTLDFESFSNRIQQLKTRQYTYTRISRALLHLILGVTAADAALWRSQDYAPYARILGFRKTAAPLLSAIKKQASVPLITKVADAGKLLEPEAYRMFSLDLHASHLYQAVCFQKDQKRKPNEFTRSVILR